MGSHKNWTALMSLEHILIW